jgi:hypothetical protein
MKNKSLENNIKSITSDWGLVNDNYEVTKGGLKSDDGDYVKWSLNIWDSDTNQDVGTYYYNSESDRDKDYFTITQIL